MNHCVVVDAVASTWVAELTITVRVEVAVIPVPATAAQRVGIQLVHNKQDALGQCSRSKS